MKDRLKSRNNETRTPRNNLVGAQRLDFRGGGIIDPNRPDILLHNQDSADSHIVKVNIDPLPGLNANLILFRVKRTPLVEEETPPYPIIAPESKSQAITYKI